MKNLSDRSSHFTDSVIRRMTRISIEHGSINLSQGYPDFNPPQEILTRLKEVADEDYHQYSITCGAANTRKALSDKMLHFSGVYYDPSSEVTVSAPVRWHIHSWVKLPT